ncbi:MAG TPA: HEAT repeat domain-containing protein, partial [Polyangia bacterium]|nr:HEAT repeat domain-containing protein [Polyangia bacterium]
MKLSTKTWGLALVAPILASLGLASFDAGGAVAATIPADKLPEGAGPPPAPGAEASYLPDLHAHVHRRWANNFLRLVGENMEASNPLNTPDRSAEVDVVIGADGQLVSTKVSRPSGFPGFDDVVIDVLKDAVPFPKPPLAVRSDDDNLHLHWLFARDQRRCAGVAVTRAYDPIEIAMPKLLQARRRDEGLNRVSLARSSGQHVEPSFTLLAGYWIKAALKIPVCPIVKAGFDSQSPADAQAAAVALASAGDAACAPGLIKLLENTKARPEARAAAVIALGPLDDGAAKKALADAVKDDNVTVRAAAVLAQVRAGSGRVKVIAMERTLRDPSPEMRAASAAGVVRAGGDTNLADLYVLFKDSDPRPSLASLRELEHLKTEESTKLVARLLRRPQPEVEKLAADVLIRRNARDT